MKKPHQADTLLLTRLSKATHWRVHYRRNPQEAYTEEFLALHQARRRVAEMMIEFGIQGGRRPVIYGGLPGEHFEFVPDWFIARRD